MAVKKTEPKKKAASNSGSKPASKAAKAESSVPLLQALPEEAWRDLFGLAKKADRDFGDKLVTALAKIDRGLLPPASSHPLQEHIAQGESGIEPLLALVESGDERSWFNGLDALAHVFFALKAKAHRSLPLLAKPM